MAGYELSLRSGPRALVVLTGALAALLVLSGPVARTAEKIDVLRIGTSDSLTGGEEAKEKGALQSLKSFIEEETGLNNEIIREKNWRELTDKMAKGQLHIGVYQGYEFAWAQEKHPKLKPLALAVNVYRYPVAYVVVRRNNPAKDFAGLQGQSLSLPTTNPHLVRLYIERQCQANGKKMDAFFSKISTPDNNEDALDDVVDGVVQVTAADRGAIEAYKRRKPGRFSQLREVAQSQPFVPPIVAYYDAVVDQPTLQRFKRGLFGAKDKAKGQQMLTLFRLTRFDAVPDDFEKVLAEVRKGYAPDSPKTD